MKRLFSIVVVITLIFNANAQVQLNGRVLELNSGKTPVPNVKIKSDSAHSRLSNSSGLFTLKFQDKYAGQPAYLWVEKQGWELVNEEDMDLYLPEQNQAMHLDVFVCKKGYLEQARKNYYKITDKHIKAEYKKRYDKIIAEKQKGWEQEVAKLQANMKSLEKQLERQAEEYIRTNRDFLSATELKARQLFEEGKIDESLRVRQSLNSEEELGNELKNLQSAKENIAKAEKELAKADSAITIHRRNLTEEANLYILKLQFDRAEYKLRKLAKIDSNNFESVARTQNNLGVLYNALNHYESALKSYREALEIYNRLAQENPEKYEPYVANTQNNLGLLYNDLNNYESALKSYREALEIYNRLALENPDSYELEVARTLVLLGLLQKKNNRGRRLAFTKLNLNEAYEITTRYPEVPLANTLQSHISDLQLYFKAYDLIADTDTMLMSLRNLDGEKKVKVQKEIILKYEEIQRLGYDFSLTIGNAYGSQAWHQLFTKNFSEAELSAKEALSPTSFTKPDGYDKELEWVHTNLALALLFQGKYEEAEKIYLAFKDKPYKEGTYKEVFLKDFAALEAEGITHTDVGKIRELLEDE